MMPRSTSRALFGLMTAAALLLALEICARIIELATPPERSAVRASPKPPAASDAYRILLFGGSTVAGWPVPEYGFPRQLEALLRRTRPNASLQMINLAVSGANSLHVRAAFEKWVPSKPDLVIVLAGHNEFLRRDARSMSSSPPT